MQESNEDGFVMPMPAALTQNVMIMGVPRTYLFCISIACFVIAIPFKQVLTGLFLWAVLYGLGRFFVQKDEYFMDVLLRALKLALHAKSGNLEG